LTKNLKVTQKKKKKTNNNKMKYWEFTEEKKESSSGEVLRQIICTQDFLHAKKGDLGGWLGENAVLKDNAWIADEAQVYDNAKVYDDAKVYDNAKLCDNAEVLTNTFLSKKKKESEEKEGLRKRLLKSVKNGDLEEAEKLIIDINAKGDGYTAALMFSIYYRKIEIVKLLLSFKDIDINDGEDFLEFALYFGDREIIELIKQFKNNMGNKKGFKETEGKLPMYTVLFKQFPNAMSECFLVDTSTHCITKLDFLHEAVIQLFKGDIKRTVLNVLKANSDELEELNTIFNFFNFTKSLQRVAQCSVLGHEKYKEHDEDWQNFSRIPDAYNHYLNAAVRHLLEGDKINEEDSTEAIKVNHLDQAAWNLMAAIEVKARVETVK